MDEHIERRCTQASAIASLGHDRDTLQRSLEGISTKIDLILAQVTRVAVLEEKHMGSSAEINRAHAYISEIREDMDSISLEVRDWISQAKGMSRMAWALWTLLSGGLGAMLIKILFFIGP